MEGYEFVRYRIAEIIVFSLRRRNQFSLIKDERQKIEIVWVVRTS